MSEESTVQQDGGAAAPEKTEAPQQVTPKSDAEVALQEQGKPEGAAAEPEKAEEAKKEPEKSEEEKQGEERKKNRTREYIGRINSENATHRANWSDPSALRQRLNEIEGGRQTTQQQSPPTLDQFDYDFAAWQEANNAFSRQQWTQEQQQSASLRQQQEAMAVYDQRVIAFADQAPDFFEAVGSIDPNFLTPEMQTAIIGHEQGPEIAYHLANNEEALWNLASVRADLLPAAVARLASRLGAAPPNPAPAPAPQQPALQPKPISQAPAPPPTVTGRSPTETPSEKLTDDEWYARERERGRKR